MVKRVNDVAAKKLGYISGYISLLFSRIIPVATAYKGPWKVTERHQISFADFCMNHVKY